MQIEQKLTEIMRKIFDDQTIVVRREMTANDVNGWDSIGHVDLLLSLEKQFNIRFKMAELGKLHNVGDLIDSIEDKLQEVS